MVPRCALRVRPLLHLAKVVLGFVLSAMLYRWRCGCARVEKFAAVAQLADGGVFSMFLQLFIYVIATEVCMKHEKIEQC